MPEVDTMEVLMMMMVIMTTTTMQEQDDCNDSADPANWTWLAARGRGEPGVRQGPPRNQAQRITTHNDMSGAATIRNQNLFSTFSGFLLLRVFRDPITLASRRL